MNSSEFRSDRILFVTTATSDANSKNMNFYQRIFFLSRNTCLEMIVDRSAVFQSAHSDCIVHRAPLRGKLMLTLYSVYWLVRFGKSRKVNAILTEPSIVSVLGFVGKLLCGIKWIVDVWDIPFRHHSSSQFVRLRMILLKRVFKTLYRYADLFIVVAALSDLELQYFELDEAKTLLLDNAIWLDDEPPYVSKASRTDRFVILCSRSLYTPDMGLDILADAFVKLKPRFADIVLLIVGEVGKEAQPQLRILENQKAVEFTGFIEYEKLRELIVEADLCVLPFKNVSDLAQTYPTSILQYFALGKPIIASRIAGIQKMIDDGVNGLLFNAGDADDLAAKIELLYKNRGLRERIAEGARKSASKYDCRTKNRVIIERIHDLIIHGQQ